MRRLFRRYPTSASLGARLVASTNRAAPGRPMERRKENRRRQLRNLDRGRHGCPRRASRADFAAPEITSANLASRWLLPERETAFADDFADWFARRRRLPLAQLGR